MQPYSMDLRQRVLKDYDYGMTTSHIAKKYSVCHAWARRLKQRRRETGEVGPKQQRRGPIPASVKYAEQIREVVEQAPDAILDELQAKLGSLMSRATLARALTALALTRKKSRCGPASKIGPT